MNTHGLVHSGECLTDEYAKDVCEGMYSEKVDQILDLIEALEAIATLNAGRNKQCQEIRRIALTAIAEQGTDLDAAGDAKAELESMGKRRQK